MTLNLNGHPRAETATRVSPPRVQVLLVGDFGADVGLAALLGEWLANSGLEHSVANAPAPTLDDLRTPSESEATVRIWVVPAEDLLTRVYLAEPGTERVLLRELPRSQPLDEIERERLAQIVLSSVLAFVDGELSSSLAEVQRSLPSAADPPLTSTPFQAAPAAPTSPHDLGTAPPPPRPAAMSLRVDVSYELVAQGPAGVSQGPGLRAALVRRGDALRLGAGLRGQARLPHSVRTDHLSLEASSLVLGLDGIVGSSLDRRVSWSGELGGGLEMSRAVPVPRDTGLRLVARDRTAGTLLRAAIGARWQGTHVGVGLCAQLEIVPLALRYTLGDAPGRAPELRYPHLQPGLTVTVGHQRSITRRRGEASTPPPTGTPSPRRTLAGATPAPP